MVSWIETGVVEAIFILGSCFNLYLLLKCCKKTTWQSLDNSKFLVVTQAIFSSITITNSLALSRVKVLPQPFCSVLPITFIFSLSLALFNLTVFVMVKHAQLTSTWKLRSSSVIWVILAELILTTLLQLEVVYSAAKGASIIICGDSWCKHEAMKSAVPSVNINVVSYAIVFVGFQFVIPSIIVISRIILAGIYLWKNGENDKERKKNQICKTMPQWINWLCAVLGFFVFLFSSHFQESEENLKMMNDVFHTFNSFSLAILCFPMLFADGLFFIKLPRDSKLSITIEPSQSNMAENQDECLIIA